MNPGLADTFLQGSNLFLHVSENTGPFALRAPQA